jgi:hypothetical protein
MASTACLVCFISTVNSHCNKKEKKRKEKKKLTLGRLALVAGTQQTWSNLFWDFRYLWWQPKQISPLFLVTLALFFIYVTLWNTLISMVHTVEKGTLCILSIFLPNQPTGADFFYAFFFTGTTS